MSKKQSKTEQLLASFAGGEQARCVAGYVALFNSARYFEAHEVLERIWLPSRGGGDDLFYKGLIQWAGVFVHLQKNRPGPALKLLLLARANLERYPSSHLGFPVQAILEATHVWESPMRAGVGNPLETLPGPSIHLLRDAAAAG